MPRKTLRVCVCCCPSGRVLELKWTNWFLWGQLNKATIRNNILACRVVLRHNPILKSTHEIVLDILQNILKSPTVLISPSWAHYQNSSRIRSTLDKRHSQQRHHDNWARTPRCKPSHIHPCNIHLNPFPLLELLSLRPIALKCVLGSRGEECKNGLPPPPKKPGCPTEPGLFLLPNVWCISTTGRKSFFPCSSSFRYFSVSGCTFSAHFTPCADNLCDQWTDLDFRFTCYVPSITNFAKLSLMNICKCM